MISAATDSSASTAPASPGSRCPSGGIRLNRWVAWRAPAAIAARASPNRAPECPSPTRCPRATSQAMRSRPPSSSGASVTMATAGCCRSTTSRMSIASNDAASTGTARPSVRRSRSPAKQAAEVRRQAAGWAPRQAGAMKLLSRWAGRTRAEPGAGSPAQSVPTSASRTSSGAGGQATLVGQKAVTPYRGSRAAMAATVPGPSSVSSPSRPCTCTSIRPGTIQEPSASATCSCTASGGIGRSRMSTIRPPSMTIEPASVSRSGSTRRAPERISMGGGRDRRPPGPAHQARVGCGVQSACRCSLRPSSGSSSGPSAIAAACRKKVMSSRLSRR